MLARDRGLRPLARRLVAPAAARQARKAAAKSVYLAPISRTSRLYLPLQARKAAAKSRLDAKAKGKGTPTRKGKVGVRVEP